MVRLGSSRVPYSVSLCGLSLIYGPPCCLMLCSFPSPSLHHHSQDLLHRRYAYYPYLQEECRRPLRDSHQSCWIAVKRCYPLDPHLDSVSSKMVLNGSQPKMQSFVPVPGQPMPRMFSHCLLRYTRGRCQCPSYPLPSLALA